MKSTKSQLNMHYEACPKKLEARQQTIINVHRKLFGNSIPKDKQYWSICGRCSYENGKLVNLCEPDQLIKAKLIRPQQFYGVEIEPTIYQFNKNSNRDINWLLGDFYDTMVEYSNHNKFNPAIINCDMLLMPKCGVEYLSRILHFITSLKIKNVMIVCNMIMKTRQHVAKAEDIISGLEKESCFQASMNECDWKIYNQFYWYNGTGKTRTKMGTIILFKY